MRTITRDELVQKGGAFDAKWAVFDAKGELYFCTVAPAAARDEAYWEGQHMTLYAVINQRQDDGSKQQLNHKESK